MSAEDVQGVAGVDLGGTNLPSSVTAAVCVSHQYRFLPGELGPSGVFRV